MAQCLLIEFYRLDCRYLLVFEQQQFVVFDLERSLLELVPLQEFGRFLSTPQQTDLHDLTLVG